MSLRILTAVSVLLLLVPGAGRAEEPAVGDGGFAKTMAGVRVRFRDPLGNPTEVTGVLEREESDLLHVRSSERLHEIRRSRVLETTPVELDPRTVFTTQELLERFVARRRAAHPNEPALTARDHWHVALYAVWLEAWEAAREHYARCAADTTFPRHIAAAAQVARIDARLREAAALAVLKQAELDIRIDRFRKARLALETFLVEHPSASEALRARHGLLLKAFALRRTKLLQMRVQGAFGTAVQVLIREKVSEPDVSITDVRAWTRRELPDEAFARVAGALHGLDDVSPAEAASLWDGRRRPLWRRVTYGGGTFVVDPAPAGGGPSRDAWWSAAAVVERAQWTLAYFVEHSGLYEVQARARRACALCRGTGTLTKTLPSGATMTYRCTRCHGLLHEVVLGYR